MSGLLRNKKKNRKLVNMVKMKRQYTTDKDICTLSSTKEKVL